MGKFVGPDSDIKHHPYLYPYDIGGPGGQSVLSAQSLRDCALGERQRA